MHWRLGSLLTVAAVLGCEHGGPFPPTDYTPTDPFNPPPLVRLTLNPGLDVMPAWLPGGEIMFTAERLDRPDHDRCLAVMRGTGGAITRYVCRTTASNDSIDVFNEATAGAGRVAYVRTGSYRIPVLPLAPHVQAIVVAPFSDPGAADVVRSIPYPAPSGRTHWGISHLQWLDSTHLVYVGEDVSYPRPCSQCPPDTVRVGLEIAVLSVAGGVFAVIPGTGGASSVAVGASSDTIYFTREGEAVLYRYVFSSAATDSIHDFGVDGGGIARDAAWAANRLFATVDGTIWMIDLAGGTRTPLLPATSNAAYHRPEPSGDGRRVLIESRTPSGAIDLWLFELP